MLACIATITTDERLAASVGLWAQGQQRLQAAISDRLVLLADLITSQSIEGRLLLFMESGRLGPRFWPVSLLSELEIGLSWCQRARASSHTRAWLSLA